MWKTIRKYFRWRHQGAHAAQFGPAMKWQRRPLLEVLRAITEDDEVES